MDSPTATLTFTPGQPWDEAESAIGDAILAGLAARAGRDFTPSQVARLVKVNTYVARHALDALVAERLIGSSGNGAWTRYGTLRVTR